MRNKLKCLFLMIIIYFPRRGTLLAITVNHYNYVYKPNLSAMPNSKLRIYEIKEIPMTKNSAAQISQENKKIDNEFSEPATIIPVIQEEIVVDKYIVEKGKVRVSKRISEHEEIIDEPLFHEEVKVERVPINKIIDAAPLVRQEGDTMIIPVVEEQAFVQKRLVLVEELRVRKQIIETHQPQIVTLRKEQVEIKRIAGK